MRLRWLLGLLLGCVLRVWVATLRVRVLRAGPSPSRPAETPFGDAVYAFFHGHQFGLLPLVRRAPSGILVSWSKDGWIQAGVMHALGLRVFRGSAGRGASSGFIGLRRWLLAQPARAAAFAVDGSRGPRGSVKPGAARLALALETPSCPALVPVASAAGWRVVFDRAWDRFELPWPFSRVVVAMGPALPAEAALRRPELLAEAIAAARSLACAELSDAPRSARRPSDRTQTAET